MSKGGAETQLIKLALFLKSLGYEILIISLKPINEFDIDYEKEGIPVIFLQNWYGNTIQNLSTIYSEIKNAKPKLVIAFMFVAIICARIYKLLFRYNLISSVRIGVLPRKWYLPYLLTYGLDDVLVYNSHASKLNFEKKLFSDKNGLVINNAIRIPKLNDCFTVKTEKEPFVWICLAHFRWNKDYNTLFKAIQLIKDYNFRVDIIGEYNDKNNPSEFIKNLNIGSKVNILGFKQDVSPYLKSADAFVLSSFSEGMPNALLEAMAYNKPVVVSNIECNIEIVNKSNCGFLFNSSDEKDLASKMQKMMDLSHSQRLYFGMSGRSYIHSCFSEKTILNNWLDIIDPYTKDKNLVLSE